MSSIASSRWAMGILIALCAACSSTPTNTSRYTSPNSTNAKPGNADANGGSSTASDGGGLSSTENPDEIKEPVTPMAAPDAGIDAGQMTDDGCVVGKFCPNKQPDNDTCGNLELRTNTKTINKPGNVLVVFDRSGSMEEDWNGSPKYQAAGNALLAAITPLKDLLTIGGVFFPSPAPDANCPDGCDVVNPLHWIPGPGACCLNGFLADSCEVSTIDKGDQINWCKADDFITALPMHWHLGTANGTPLQAGVQRANDAISAQMFTDPLVVLIMTDGEPNCMTDSQMVIDQVTAWKNNNIPTYVVGLPGAQAAADLLNSIASAGGTDTYIDPKDPQELETKLGTVVSSTVKTGFDSCSFTLDPKAEVPDKLHLVIKYMGMESDVPHDWSMDATWTVNSDGSQVDLNGQLCDMAKDGTIESLRFVYGCVDVPPPPPPPPPPMLN